MLYLGDTQGFSGATVVKNPPANVGDAGLIPGSGRFPGGGNSNPLQYSCLENPMDRGAWRATAHGVSNSRTRLSMHTQVICRSFPSCRQLDYKTELGIKKNSG